MRPLTWKQTPWIHFNLLVNEYLLGFFQWFPRINKKGFRDTSVARASGWAETYCRHAADLIQGQPQQLLIAALGHQFEGRLLQVGSTLEHQAGDASDALKR